MSSTLPAGWSQVLDEVRARLEQAIVAADARLAEMPPEREPAQARSAVEWNERLQRLHMLLESAEQVVHSVDEVLHKEETHLRQQLALSTSLRQKL